MWGDQWEAIAVIQERNKDSRYQAGANVIQGIFQEVKLAKYGDRLEILDEGKAGIKDIS